MRIALWPFSMKGNREALRFNAVSLYRLPGKIRTSVVSEDWGDSNSLMLWTNIFMGMLQAKKVS